MLMDGYFCGAGKPLNPSLDRDGYFATGDMAELDERGTLFVRGRRTDLVVTGGENVYPIEVEQCIERIPGVRRAVVFGVPDARWGQIVAVALEVDPTTDLESVLSLSRMALAPHKRPRLGCVVPTLPLTSSGKLDRTRLLERFGAVLQPVRWVSAQ
jgi:O-succinylbenzoic acid--CoA ligase